VSRKEEQSEQSKIAFYWTLDVSDLHVSIPRDWIEAKFTWIGVLSSLAVRSASLCAKAIDLIARGGAIKPLSRLLIKSMLEAKLKDDGGPPTKPPRPRQPPSHHLDVLDLIH
jgi:hypothetical protein